MSEDKVQKKNKLSSSVIIIGMAGIIILLISIMIYMIFINKKDPEKVEPESYNMVVTPENVNEIVEKMEKSEKTEIGSYEVYMNTTWTFDNSMEPSFDAIVSNRVTNSNTVYFTIELKESGQQVYKSPYIPVGASLNNIVLDEKLDSGTYDAILTYHLVDDKYVEESTVSVNMTLVIKN